MAYNEPIIHTSNPFRKITDKGNEVRNIYYGEVVSIDDPTDGGIIKVKVLSLDNKTTDNNLLPDCYPLLPKFLHVYPKVGEVVRIMIEDMKYPQRGRFWVGSIISQPQKFEFDSIYTALSTTNMGVTSPQKAVSTFPDAEGVFPLKSEIGIIGRVNTDIVLRDNQLEFRAGKHVNGDVLKLNVKNPASFTLTYERVEDTDEFKSNSIILSDRIALISHEGSPKFKAARIDSEERTRIFNEAHPIARGDVLVEALDIIRRAVVAHIHGYSGLPADKSSIINDLESLNLDAILQKNIVIN